MHWYTILGMAVVTYATRAVPLLFGGGQLPGWLARGLAYVPVALFAALAVPSFVRPQGSIALGPELAAGVVAAFVAWRTSGRTYWVLAAGLATYGLVRVAVERFA